MNFHFQKTFVILLSSACALPNCVLAGTGVAAGRNLVFAVGYGLGEDHVGQVSDNVVAIGTIGFDGERLTVIQREFDANANLRPHQVEGVRHNLEASYGKHACSDKQFSLPTESAKKSFRGTWTSNGQDLQLTFGSKRFDWANDGVTGAYRLIQIVDLNSGQKLPLVAGYAYSSNDEKFPKLTKANFAPYYKGEIFHKNNNSVATTPWEYKSSGFKVSAFNNNEGGDLLSYSSPDNKGAWVAYGVLLNQDTSSNAFIYSDFGHDWNKNGCYDESGHHKVLLAAHDDDSLNVSRMVYVEYSYTLRGFPMLSVGRYYK